MLPSVDEAYGSDLSTAASTLIPDRTLSHTFTAVVFVTGN